MSAVDESGECWPHPAGPPNDLQESITYIEQCVLSSHNARKHWKVVSDAIGTMRQQLTESEAKLARFNADGTTHWDGCHLDGPKHWGCAVAKLTESERLLDEARTALGIRNRGG